MTSLIRLVVPSSMPFIREMTIASRPSRWPQSARLARRVCDGTESTMISAPSVTSAGSVEAEIPEGREKPGR